jgi:hypothetical protein
MDEKPKDNWVNGDLYEGYMGRWSRHVAREFIKWLAVPTVNQWLGVLSTLLGNVCKMTESSLRLGMPKR